MAVVVDRKTKLTYEDYLQFPEDGRRHEIVVTLGWDDAPIDVDLSEVW